ncbi:MAG: hypothetical protein A2868_00880 [Candidatus Levybacteria bacterium RIFCSPHIGHO2_01_FULL_40_15b]|nr:MAG: hypothetical protein A2868_00880 [Candidatus Levybacteria bacterium RIFCSPHIGHO2_01_FULL_40_15b]
MSNYVTTNIRISEEDYLRLKEEAFKKRKSFASLIREKIRVDKDQKSKSRVESLMVRIRKHAKENAKNLEGFDIVEALREMRYKGKW